MGPVWDRTVQHMPAAAGTDDHESCPLTCTNCLWQHQLSPSGTPAVSLLIVRLT
jgi:hypothetical protein